MNWNVLRMSDKYPLVINPRYIATYTPIFKIFKKPHNIAKFYFFKFLIPRYIWRAPYVFLHFYGFKSPLTPTKLVLPLLLVIIYQCLGALYTVWRRKFLLYLKGSLCLWISLLKRKGILWLLLKKWEELNTYFLFLEHPFHF